MQKRNSITSKELTRRRLMEMGGVSAFGLLIASCSADQNAPSQTSNSPVGKPVRGGDLIFSTNLDIQTLDPAFSQNFSERFAYYAMYNTLVGYDTDFNLVPELATDWETSNNSKSLILNLRSGVKFHDGTKFDASAVKWNLDRLVDEGVNSPLRGLLTPPLKSVNVVDDLTVRLDLSTSWRPLLAALGERPGYIVSPTAVEKYGKDYGRNPVGTGPFRFESYTSGSNLVMNRFSEYWDPEKPYLDSITMSNTADQQVQLSMIRTGEAHIMDALSPQLAATLENSQGVELRSEKTGAWYASQLDTDKPPFDNLELRQAIAHATKREATKDTLFKGQARVAKGPIGIGWAFNPSAELAYPFDLEQAKTKVAQAGATGMAVDFINSSETSYQSVAQLLQGGFSDIGLNVNVGSVPGSDYYSQVVADKINWSVTKWTPRADPDGLLRILFHSAGSQNTTGYNNPEVDRLLDEAAGMFDTDAAAELYHQVSKIVEEDAPYAWVVWPDVTVPYRSNVQNLNIYPDNIYRLSELWLSK